MSEGLCGAFRPGHFDGVATVVMKLLLQTGVDLAYFGEKDFQQVQVVRRVARDLDIPVEIIACPTVREPDALAMSSRNVRLSEEERRVAPLLARTLSATAEEIGAGADVESSLGAARQALLAGGFREVEYLELRAAETLEPLPTLDRPARLLAAAWLGDTRLLDNVPVNPRGGAGGATRLVSAGPCPVPRRGTAYRVAADRRAARRSTGRCSSSASRSTP